MHTLKRSALKSRKGIYGMKPAEFLTQLFYRPSPGDGVAEMGVIRANHLVTACFLAVTNFAAYAALYQWLGDHGSAILCGVGVCFSLVFMVLARLSRWVAPVRETMILTVFILLLTLTWRLGGITATTVIWFVCCPIIAILTGGIGSGLAWAAITMAGAGWVYAWPATGVAIPPSILSKEKVELLAVISSVSFCLTLATFAAIFELRNRRNITKLEVALERIARLAIRDELTGLFNRRHFMSLVEAERRRSSRDGSPFCLCLIDIDHFKQINDVFGHHVGDQVLIEFAKLLSNLTRETDCLARYGGEEFILILPATDKSRAFQLINRIRQEIESNHFASLPQDHVLTASFGAAQYELGLPLNDNLILADRALYKAKHEGRNTVQLGN
jgi:diguanylate cyclase (GGDEF)-like protein